MRWVFLYGCLPYFFDVNLFTIIVKKVLTTASIWCILYLTINVNNFMEGVMNLEKMKKMAGGLEKFAGVLQKSIVICMIAAVCVAAVLTIANAVKPGIVIGENLNTVDVGNLTFELAEEAQLENGEALSLVWIVLALDAVYVAGFWYILKVFRRILLPMKEGNPFSGTVCRDIRKSAWAVMVTGVISNLVTMLEVAVEMNQIMPRLEEGALGSYLIRNITVNYTFDAGFLVVFAILMLVAWIFAYGAELQKLSDETL